MKYVIICFWVVQSWAYGINTVFIHQFVESWARIKSGFLKSHNGYTTKVFNDIQGPERTDRYSKIEQCH